MNRKSDADFIWALLRFLRPYAGQVALSVLLGAVTIASGIGLLGVSAFLIASAALQPSVAALQVAIVGVRFFGISRAVFRYLERLTSHSVNFHLLAALRVWFYTRLEPLAPARLQGTHSADLLTRAIADVETLENFYVRAVAPPLVAVIVTAGVGLFAARQDVRFALALVGILALAGLGVPLLTHHLARRPGQQVVDRRARLHACVLDAVQGLPEIQAFGSQADHLRRVQAESTALHNAQRRLGRGRALGAALNLLLNGLALWIVLVIAIPLVGNRIDGVGLAVIALVTMAAFEAAAPLPQAAAHLESSLQSARRLLELVDEPPEVRDPLEPLHMSPGPLDIRIRGLALAYDRVNKSSPALADFDLDLPPGKHAALVGASGSGKTTLFNLLMRFWEYDSGEILINGQEARLFSPDAIRARIALVSQSTYLFTGTLRQNLLLAAPDATEIDLRRAAAQAGLSDFLSNLPDGLDTWVGERGLALSGGERQRIAVARALLRDAPLLLLDEPSANLDPVSEQRLLEALRRASAGRSVISITHRLTGMEAMDEILVLRGGRVVERGTHAELLAACGRYAQMWQIQEDMLA